MAEGHTKDKFVNDFVKALHAGDLKGLYEGKKYKHRDKGKDINEAMFENGKTPLIYSIEWFQKGTNLTRKEESMAMINTVYGLESRSTIQYSKADNTGNTPLMYAAEILHLLAVNYILRETKRKVSRSFLTVRNGIGETFLLKLLKAATKSQIEDNTRKGVEEIVFELLTVDTEPNREQRSINGVVVGCISRADLMEATDQKDKDVFDYLLHFGSVKCISAALGKHQLLKLNRQAYFDKCILKCINECKYSMVVSILEGIDGISSELRQSDFFNYVSFPLSIKASIIQAYNKEEILNVDVKKLIAYLFKFSEFRRANPDNGQSILHTLAANITPHSSHHKDGDNIIIYMLEHYGDVNINAQDSNGNTVLMYAVKNNFSIHTFRTIINYENIDMTIKNNEGHCVMDMLDNGLSAEARSVIEKAYNKQVYVGQAVHIDTTLSFKQQIAFMRGSIDQDNALTEYQKRYFQQSLTCMESDYDLHTAGKLKTSEGMSDLHKGRLIGKRVYLCEELSVDENVLSHLIQYKVIDEDILEEITKIPTRRSKVVKLLSILPLRGPKAYDNFINMLNNTQNEFIADELEKFDPDATVEVGDEETALKTPFAAAAGSELLPGGGLGFGIPGAVVNRSADGTAHLIIPMVTLPTTR